MFILKFLGDTISRILNVLEILDRHNFDRVEVATSIDSLYQKVFSAEKIKDTNNEVIMTACSFGLLNYSCVAVTTKEYLIIII